MKNLFVRLSVLALALTGFTASTIASQASSKKSVVKAPIVGTICPPCLPSDPSHCGMH